LKQGSVVFDSIVD